MITVDLEVLTEQVGRVKGRMTRESTQTPRLQWIVLEPLMPESVSDRKSMPDTQEVDSEGDAVRKGSKDAGLEY
jgi:hypothetical protein